MAPWLCAVRATRAGLALRAGVALGVVTGAVSAAGAGAGVAMPYSAAVAPFGAPVPHGSEGAVGGRQGAVAGRSDVPSRATAHLFPPLPVPSSPPLLFRPASAAKPSLTPSTEPSRAGSRAGEGRKRPGREVPVPEGRGERPETSDGAGKADPEGGRDGGPSDGRADGGGRGTGDGVSGVPERPGEAHAGARDTGPAPDSGDGTDGSEEPGAGAAHRTPPSQEAAVTGPSEVSRQPTANTATDAERSAGPMLHILPLGSGLVLMGLGLGLAFVGLRLRRS